MREEEVVAAEAEQRRRSGRDKARLGDENQEMPLDSETRHRGHSRAEKTAGKDNFLVGHGCRNEL